MVLGFYPPQIPPGWLPCQPPRAFFTFGFWGFTRPKSPQVGCLPNPPRFLCFRFLVAFPTPRAFFAFGFGVLPAPNPPRLVAFPTPRAFFAFGFWGFTRPKSPQVGCLPNPPRFLFFRFLGFYPPLIPPGWLPSQPPVLSLLSVFGVFTHPKPHRLVAFPTPRSFFAFQFWGFIRPKLPGLFSSIPLTLSLLFVYYPA